MGYQFGELTRSTRYADTNTFTQSREFSQFGFLKGRVNLGAPQSSEQLTMQTLTTDQFERESANV